MRLIACLTLLTSLYSASGLANPVKFMCPTANDNVSVAELGHDQALETMYAPMMQGWVWGSNGSDSSSIVFQDNQGSFKIGYDYRAKECERQIVLEEEISPGVWSGHTIVNVCSPAVAAQFKGETDFETGVWPKLQALAVKIDQAAEKADEEYEACNQENDDKYDTLYKMSDQLSLFKDNNGDGVVNGDDYQDSNGNGIADNGDLGIVDGKTYDEFHADYDALNTEIDNHYKVCRALMEKQFDISGKADSLRGLEMTDEYREDVTWIKENGEIKAKFSVPLKKFHFTRKEAWTNIPDPVTGYYLFHDEKGLNPVFTATKGCEMIIKHKLSYGGLAKNYAWDFNYDVAYKARTWGYDSKGESLQDEFDTINDLSLLEILDYDKEDFTVVEEPEKYIP